MRSCTASHGDGRFGIKAAAHICGNDVSASFVGGEKAHIGATSIAVYEPVRDSATVSTMTVFSHRDDQLSALGAKRLAKRLACTAVVTVGIHIDNATDDELSILCQNFEKCLDALADALVSARSDARA